jgi:hypothetical protein
MPFEDCVRGACCGVPKGNRPVFRPECQTPIRQHHRFSGPSTFDRDNPLGLAIREIEDRDCLIADGDHFTGIQQREPAVAPTSNNDVPADFGIFAEHHIMTYDHVGPSCRPAPRVPAR